MAPNHCLPEARYSRPLRPCDLWFPSIIALLHAPWKLGPKAHPFLSTSSSFRFFLLLHARACRQISHTRDSGLFCTYFSSLSAPLHAALFSSPWWPQREDFTYVERNLLGGNASSDPCTEVTIRDHAYPLDDVYCYVNGWYDLPRQKLISDFDYVAA